MRALLIRQQWLDKILDGKKTWEIRGSRTSFRETIGLIASRSGTVIGVSDLVDCIGPLTDEEYLRNRRKIGKSRNDSTLSVYRQTYAWVLKNPRKLRRPVPYRHPSGAVIWVKLEDAVERRVKKQLDASGHR